MKRMRLFLFVSLATVEAFLNGLHRRPASMSLSMTEPDEFNASAPIGKDTEFETFQEQFVESVGEAVMEETPIEDVVEEIEEEEPVVAGKEEEEKKEDDTNEPSFDATKSWSFLQSLGAITGRGEFAKPPQHRVARNTIEQLEASFTSSSSDDDITGTWELLYTDTQLFRSSPFFMAGRAVCDSEVDIQRYNWFCDMHRAALAISTIRNVRQIVSKDTLRSEFEVSAGAIPFLNDFTPFSYSGGLPISITGALVSNADVTLTDTMDMELYMDTVSIQGSNIPLVRQILDRGVKLESRKLAQFLEDNVSSYSTPKPVFRTTYLDDTFRISRDQDDHVFVYLKTSESTEPTNYDTVDSDLGVARLLEGFNDAVTRIYQ